MDLTTAVSAAMNANLLTAGEASQRQCRKVCAIAAGPTGMSFTFPTCAAGNCAHWRWKLVPGRIQAAGVTAEPRGCCGLAGDV